MPADLDDSRATFIAKQTRALNDDDDDDDDDDGVGQRTASPRNIDGMHPGILFCFSILSSQLLFTC